MSGSENGHLTPFFFIWQLEHNVYENMQESQEVPMSNHLDEVIAAVSDTAKRIPNKLLQTALFQPPREKLHLCEEKAKSHLSNREVRSLEVTHLLSES